MLALHDKGGAPLSSATVRAEFRRPIERGLDFTVALRPRGDGRYDRAGPCCRVPANGRSCSILRWAATGSRPSAASSWTDDSLVRYGCSRRAAGARRA